MLIPHNRFTGISPIALYQATHEWFKAPTKPAVLAELKRLSQVAEFYRKRSPKIKHRNPKPALDKVPAPKFLDTGWFGKPSDIPGGEGRHTNVHVRGLDGHCICGYRPAKGYIYQWCAPGAMIPYIECPRCLAIVHATTKAT